MLNYQRVNPNKNTNHIQKTTKSVSQNTHESRSYIRNLVHLYLFATSNFDAIVNIVWDIAWYCHFAGES